MPKSICTRAAHEAGLTPSDLERLVGVARSAADAGGQELMRHYGRLSSIESKGRIGDLVTNADLAAERIVLDQQSGCLKISLRHSRRILDYFFLAPDRVVF